jgi:hypothetical protein
VLKARRMEKTRERMAASLSKELAILSKRWESVYKSASKGGGGRVFSIIYIRKVMPQSFVRATEFLCY